MKVTEAKMFDIDFSEILNLNPGTPEHGESTAEVIRNRPNDLWDSVEAIGRAASAMLGGVQERVENFTHLSDVVLAPAVATLSGEAAIYHNTQQDGSFELNTASAAATPEILAKNDLLAQETAAEDAERDRIVYMEEYRQSGRGADELNNQRVSAQSAREAIKTVTQNGYVALPSEPKPAHVSEGVATQVPRTPGQLQQQRAAQEKIDALLRAA